MFPKQPMGSAVGQGAQDQAVGSAVGQVTGALGTMLPFQGQPDFEIRTLNNFLQGPVSDLIKKLYEYLNAHSEQAEQLSGCIPVLAQAAQVYGTGDYPTAFNLAYQIYRQIALVQATNQTLPAL